MNARALAAALTAAALAGCSGTGSNGLPVPQGGASSPAAARALHASFAAGKHKRAGAYARFVIPREKKHTGRGSRFVSSATMSASIVATSAGNGSVTTIADLSPSSGSCSTSGGTRSCNVLVEVPIGNDTIKITTYDKAPSGGVIPADADELGFGSTTQQVSNGGTAPSITIFLSGLIASIGVSPAFASLPANRSTSTAMFVIDPVDFGNQPIKAGSSDPYLHPIQVSLAESGGTGHAALLLNGTATGTSATLRVSTDAVSLQYDGLGKPGYTTVTTLSAQGVTPVSARVSPLYVTSPSIINYSGVNTLGVNGNGSGIGPVTLTISEADAPAGTTYTVTRSGCAGVATASSVSGTGPSATFTVTGGASASASGCTISVTDSNSPSATVALATTNTPITGSISINGVQITEYGNGVTAPTDFITKGPDGNMWFDVLASGTIGIINPSTQTLVNSYNVPNGSLYGLTAGPDGAVWIADQGNYSFDRVTPAGSITEYVTPGSPYTGRGFGAVSSPIDGTLWFTDEEQTLWNVNVGGGLTQPSFSLSGSSPTWITWGPDNAIWFVEGTYIGRYDPVALQFSETATPNGNPASGIATGPDGNIWFTQNVASGTSTVASLTPCSVGNCTTTTHALNSAAKPGAIAAGLDNAMWFVDQGNNSIDRISLSSGAIKYYGIVTMNAQPSDIDTGPDGSLWFTESGANSIGHVIP